MTTPFFDVLRQAVDATATRPLRRNLNTIGPARYGSGSTARRQEADDREAANAARRQRTRTAAMSLVEMGLLIAAPEIGVPLAAGHAAETATLAAHKQDFLGAGASLATAGLFFLPGASAAERAVVKKILAAAPDIANAGGATLSPLTGEAFTGAGYIVAGLKKVKPISKLTPAAILKAIRAVPDGEHIGMWLDKSKKWWLEPAEAGIKSFDDAVQRGVNRGEQAIFDNDAKENIFLLRHHSPLGNELKELNPRYAGSSGLSGAERIRTDRPKALHYYDPRGPSEPQFKDLPVVYTPVRESQIIDLGKPHPPHIEKLLKGAKSDTEVERRMAKAKLYVKNTDPAAYGDEPSIIKGFVKAPVFRKGGTPPEVAKMSANDMNDVIQTTSEKLQRTARVKFNTALEQINNEHYVEWGNIDHLPRKIRIGIRAKRQEKVDALHATLDDELAEIQSTVQQLREKLPELNTATAPPAPSPAAPAILKTTPEGRSLHDYLLPEEQALMSAGRAAPRQTEKFEEAAATLLPTEVHASAAIMGSPTRGFYADATPALTAKYGKDMPRFAQLMAALSPQTSVEMNLANAQSVMSAWKEGLSPIDAIRKGISGLPMDSWVPNAMRALTTETPEALHTLSGPKVQRFAQNAMGNHSLPTLDAHMSHLQGWNPARLAGRKIAELGEGRFANAPYLAYSARLRQVAERLNLVPDETQAAEWGFKKALQEHAMPGHPQIHPNMKIAEEGQFQNLVEDIGTAQYSKNPSIPELLGQAPTGLRGVLSGQINPDFLRRIAKLMEGATRGEYIFNAGALAAGGFGAYHAGRGLLDTSPE